MAVEWQSASAEDAFFTLKRYDVWLSPRIVVILKRLGYDTLKGISRMKVDTIENSVRRVLGDTKRYGKMSNEDKIAVFGEEYANDPTSFEFLPGEKDAIESAIAEAGEILDKYKGQYCYDRPVIPGSKRKLNPPKGTQPKVARLNSSTVKIVFGSGTTRAEASPATTSASTYPDGRGPENESGDMRNPGDVVRKGKTLAEYIGKWLANTKYRLLYSLQDFKVDGRTSQITCLKCLVKPFKAHIDSNEGWKVSSFIRHVTTTHLELFDPDSPSNQLSLKYLRV